MHRGAKRSQRGMREYNLQEKACSCRPANQHRPLTAAIASAEASARADGAIVRLGVFLNPTSEAVFPVHGAHWCSFSCRLQFSQASSCLERAESSIDAGLCRSIAWLDKGTRPSVRNTRTPSANEKHFRRIRSR